MTRAALLIGGLAPDLIGVEADLENFKAFLQSPAGGAWRPTEITTLKSPGELQVDLHLGLLKSAQYSFVAFAGHGDHHNGKTRVQLKDGVVIGADKLKVGAPKHTLVVDCCRVITQTRSLSMEQLTEKFASAGLDPVDARAAFDAELAKCSAGLVTLYSCAVGEKAGEAGEGGFYSFELIDGAKKWSRAQRSSSGTYKSLDAFTAHGVAAVAVQGRSGGRQNPNIEKPRSGPYFPFAIG